MPDYPAYQTLKTEELTVYCSRKKVKGREEGKQWVKDCMARFGLTAADVRSEDTAQSQPDRAIIWP